MCRLETGGNKSKNPASKREIQAYSELWRARQFQRRPSLKEADVKEMSRPFDRCAGERGDYSEFQNFCKILSETYRLAAPSRRNVFSTSKVF
jgi:hypothetical protein